MELSPAQRRRAAPVAATVGVCTWFRPRLVGGRVCRRPAAPGSNGRPGRCPGRQVDSRRGSARRIDEVWHVGDHPAVRAAARARLGEKAYAAAFDKDARMNFADAIAYALEEKPSTPTRVSHGQQNLTRRELEIAALVAEGLSNKQIAARLVIGQRTAETHIENIMNKLG